jgi:hypothetical protein
MSDERFVLKFNSQENEYFIRDNFEEEEELGSYTLKWGVRKLNEQQSIIEAKDKRINELEIMLKKCDAERIRLQNERGAIIKFDVRGGSV